MTAKHVSNGCTSTLVEIGADTLQVNKEIAHDSADMSILMTEEPDFASSLEIVKAQAQAALDKMHDPKLAMPDKLTSQDGATFVERELPSAKAKD